jgi:hypothetical protein
VNKHGAEMTMSPAQCAVCGMPLGHIDDACPKCLPNFHSDHSANVVTLAPSQSKRLKVYGMGRVGDNPQALLLILNQCPTDNQLRYLHDVMRRAAECMPKDLQ